LSTVLGVYGVLESFGFLYLADRVLLIDRALVPSLIYLQLSIAGHLTIFVTRTRYYFWSIRPSLILTFAVLGTQALATLIATYGLLMPGIGWWWALGVWAFCVPLFLVQDGVKLGAYRILDLWKRGLLIGKRE
jgi:H+-transporting ATPase